MPAAESKRTERRSMSQSHDLVIGCYDNYSWEIINFWVNSLDKSGFDGRRIMIVMNSDTDTAERLAQKNFAIVTFEREGTRITYDSGGIPVHVGRFFHIWHVLHSLAQHDRPRFVITTDVRDVVFQSNPSRGLESNFMPGKEILTGSEGIRYSDEPWGNRNLLDAFGPMLHDLN